MIYAVGASGLGVKRRLAYRIIIAVLLLGLPSAVVRAEVDKPIIALLYDDMARYDGRSVTIYGLVIETAKLGREFLLQDVSQMPLRIVRTEGFPAFVGDQMLVQGVFVANDGNPYLEARKITYTKVLGGGGCC
jgi:hypothetical protein